MIRRPSQSRIVPVPLDTADADIRETLSSALTVNGRPLNIFGVLAHHPALLKRFNQMGGFLLYKGQVPAREREILILRIGWNARSEYEFGQHTIIGLKCGLTHEEIAALTREPQTHPWNRGDRMLIALADDLSADDCASDQTWSGLRERWTDAQIVELLVVAGFYRLVSGFLNSVGVALDEGVPGFPANNG